MLAAIFLIIGLVIGTRVGLRGLIMFWGGIGLIYLMIKIPLGVHGFILKRLVGNSNAELAAVLMLIGSLVLLLWIALQLGWILIEVFYLDELPEGVNRVFGGVLGGALGWILIKIVFKKRSES